MLNFWLDQSIQVNSAILSLQLTSWIIIEIYYANADDIDANLQPVKIKHMANQG